MDGHFIVVVTGWS